MNLPHIYNTLKTTEANRGYLIDKSIGYLAERVGFEPTVPLLVRRFSRPLPSTARSSLQYAYNLAERGGFEPPRRIAPPYRFSKPTPSTTWVPLLIFEAILQKKRDVKSHFACILYLKINGSQ